jgi:hypothetical protein
MKLHSAVQNEAIVSNVGEIGEFRIRNSAKAFSILSSGLYANKVRAIVRELSCNAVDSHTAAGKQNTPFDVHLPNSLEPYFSIRDYGTGLSHDQVTNIYTTYFESTKTASNEFIGALGLGSKSPFSYTDNFTVTAIKDGRKGIYTAFINEQGVPSIAQMMEEQTTDPSGVEVRFAVEERYDFDKFRQEAKYVYEYFKLRPVVSGSADFTFKDPTYKEKDIIPGVHYMGEDRGRNSYAIMGNIKYPIEVPNADKALGGLHGLLSCGIVMEFSIGELDFQASREGLSYIPETINAIKSKLEALNAQLAIHIANEANKIDNLWDRALFLSKRHSEYLFTQAVNKYVTDTKFELFDPMTNRWDALKSFKLDTGDLAKKYNVNIRGFSKSRSYAACSTIKPNTSHVPPTIPNGTHTTNQEWSIRIDNDVHFVINDTKVGALERAKFHWKTSKSIGNSHSVTVYVIEAADKTKPVLTNDFFASISNPPEAKISVASSLLEKERSGGIGKNVTIMILEEGASRGRWSSTRPMVWHDAGKANSFDSKETYYYLPLSGFQSLGVCTDVKEMHLHLNKSGLYTGNIYGVRKSDIEWVKTQKNWVDIDEHIKGKLSQLNQNDVLGLVKKSIDFNDLYQYNATKHVTDKNSPYVKLYNVFKDVKAEDSNKKHSLEVLCRNYRVQTQSNIDPTSLIDKYNKEVESIYKRYPLLKRLSKYSTEGAEVAEYINLIDAKKGV